MIEIQLFCSRLVLVRDIKVYKMLPRHVTSVENKDNLKVRSPDSQMVTNEEHKPPETEVCLRINQ